jgi:hypothetical protein
MGEMLKLALTLCACPDCRPQELDNATDVTATPDLPVPDI